jgi:hypothetical protein
MARSIAQLHHCFAGKPVSFTLAPGVEIPAQVEEVKVGYGRELLRISPTHGTGSLWVEAKRCTVVAEDHWHERAKAHDAL